MGCTEEKEKEEEMSDEENDYKNYPEDEVKIYKEIKDREFYLGIAFTLTVFIGGIAVGAALS